MSFQEFVESEGYKKIMAKVYGFGASIVLIGALFKIQHWPFAGPMLIVGLFTEALIFFLSAFEPLHHDLDWTLVYPELAGLQEIEDGIDNTVAKKQPEISALEKFDKMLLEANIGPDLFEKLSKGMNNLGTQAGKIADMTDASVATQQYAKNVEGAAKSVEKLSDSYQKSADAINKTAEVVSTSGESYKNLLEGLNKNFSSIGTNSKHQAEQQEVLTKNLSALNAVYEMQLKSSNDNLQATQSVASGIFRIVDDLKSTASDVAQYKDEVAKLSKNLSALNTVYGNILSAMNIK